MSTESLIPAFCSLCSYGISLIAKLDKAQHINGYLIVMVILNFYSDLAVFAVTKGNFKHLSRSGYMMTILFSMLSTKIF